MPWRCDSIRDRQTNSVQLCGRRVRGRRSGRYVTWHHVASSVLTSQPRCSIALTPSVVYLRRMLHTYC